MSSYRDLIVWRKSLDLAQHIYIATRGYPTDERFGITSQMRRAAASIAANIAEGQARNSSGEFHQFLGVAKGSLAELETFLLLSERLNYLSSADVAVLLEKSDEISKMLHSLSNSLKRN